MWGSDDSPPQDDDEMSVDYSIDSEVDENDQRDTNVNDWKAMVAEHWMTKGEIDEYERLPALSVTPESEIKTWSSEEESLNPWVAVEKWCRPYLSHGDMDRGKAYWLGSDNVVRYMPHLLIKQLGKIEKYWRTWLYDEDSIKERSESGWTEESKANCHAPRV